VVKYTTPVTFFPASCPVETHELIYAHHIAQKTLPLGLTMKTFTFWGAFYIKNTRKLEWDGNFPGQTETVE
jgi:hypothetical protein